MELHRVRTKFNFYTNFGSNLGQLLGGVLVVAIRLSVYPSIRCSYVPPLGFWTVRLVPGAAPAGIVMASMLDAGLGVTTCTPFGVAPPKPDSTAPACRSTDHTYVRMVFVTSLPSGTTVR